VRARDGAEMVDGCVKSGREREKVCLVAHGACEWGIEAAFGVGWGGGG